MSNKADEISNLEEGLSPVKLKNNDILSNYESLSEQENKTKFVITEDFYVQNNIVNTFEMHSTEIAAEIVIEPHTNESNSDKEILSSVPTPENNTNDINASQANGDELVECNVNSQVKPEVNAEELILDTTLTQDEGIRVTKFRSIEEETVLFTETADIPINKRKGKMTKLLEEEISFDVYAKKCGFITKRPLCWAKALETYLNDETGSYTGGNTSKPINYTVNVISYYSMRKHSYWRYGYRDQNYGNR